MWEKRREISVLSIDIFFLRAARLAGWWSDQDEQDDQVGQVDQVDPSQAS